MGGHRVSTARKKVLWRMHSTTLCEPVLYVCKRKRVGWNQNAFRGLIKRTHLHVHLRLQKMAPACLWFMLYTCPLASVSFCAVLPTTPKVFGFVAKHPAADMYHCYLFQSKTFSHLLVSIIGDAFRATNREQSLRVGGRDLIVEALRHKNKVLQRENTELRMRLNASGD
uniref:PID domain-containing protein n=1 Tax=Esox lucius TaxID=8010 RepID=A0AAY5KTY4_ESOLU